jgi:thiamine-monophosphate kinase
LPKLTLEQDLIKIIKQRCQSSQAYIGDDCAVVDLTQGKYLFCLDNFTEGTHYSEEYFSPEDIGWKALAVNLSDIAAHAGDPLYILVGLSLNKAIPDKPRWVEDFYKGLHDCAGKFGNAQVIGGDISASHSHTSISVTVIGKALPQNFLRSSAKPGDKICVTGKFGNSANFLAGNQFDASNIRYHLRPEPRIQAAKELSKLNERGALMDASDGLVATLIEIAEQSGVNLEIDTALIPKDKFVTLSEALYGGEDYELVACLEHIPDNFTYIGEVRNQGETPMVIDIETGQSLTKAKIFSHF